MPNNFDEWRKATGLPGLEPAAVSYYDAGQLILDAAAEGLGIAFMLDSHLSCSNDDRLVQIFEQTVESPYAYWFACSPGALSRRAVRAFHDWLFDTFTRPNQGRRSSRTSLRACGGQCRSARLSDTHRLGALEGSDHPVALSPR